MNKLYRVLLLVLLVVFVAVPCIAADPALAEGVSLDSKAVILACLLAGSEALALIPALKSNSIFQLCFNIVKWVAGRRAK